MVLLVLAATSPRRRSGRRGTPARPRGPAGLQRCSADSEAYCGSVEVPLDRTGATPGSLSIAFRYYPRSDTSRPPLPRSWRTRAVLDTPRRAARATTSILPAVDGPAGAAAGRRAGHRWLGPCLPEAESYDGHWVANAEACAERLGRAADLYTTAAAVEDMADVLAELEIDAVDLYGDS